MVITSSPGDGTSSDSWISDIALPDSQKLLWKRASADVESRDFLQCDRPLKNTNSQVKSKKRNSCTNSLFTKAMWRSKLGTVKAPFPRQTPQTHKFPSTTSGHTNHGMCKPNRRVNVSKINKMATGNVTSERSHGNMDYLWCAYRYSSVMRQATSLIYLWHPISKVLKLQRINKLSPGYRQNRPSYN